MVECVRNINIFIRQRANRNRSGRSKSRDKAGTVGEIERARAGDGSDLAGRSHHSDLIVDNVGDEKVARRILNNPGRVIKFC